MEGVTMEGEGGIMEVGVEGEDGIKGLTSMIGGGGEEVRRKGRGKEGEHSWMVIEK